MDDEPFSKIASDVEALVFALDNVTDWLEGTEAYAQNHGAHSAAVEARKLLAKVKGGEE